MHFPSQHMMAVWYYRMATAAAAAKSLQSGRPQGWQPTKLPRPWDSPGKNTEWQ